MLRWISHLMRRRLHDAVCAANGLFELLIGARLAISAESQLQPSLQVVLRLPLLHAARPLHAGRLWEAALDHDPRRQVRAADGLLELFIGARLAVSAESQLRPPLQHVLRLPLLLTARPLRAGGLLEAALDRPIRLC